MNEKSWNSLYEKYPNLFINRNKTPMESCMSFGIECNIGWYDIISSVCHMIDQHEKNENYKVTNHENYEYHPVTFDQVKEKFGGLRMYFSGGDEYISGLVAMAESFSYKICEGCGERGKSNKSGWIVTLCDKCRDKYNNSRESGRESVPTIELLMKLYPNYSWLPIDQLKESLYNADVFIGGIVRNDNVTLIRGNLKQITVNKSIFLPSGQGPSEVFPDFNRFKIDDYGHAVCFGEYEASSHYILFTVDDDYRKQNEEKNRNE